MEGQTNKQIETQRGLKIEVGKQRFRAIRKMGSQKVKESAVHSKGGGSIAGGTELKKTAKINKINGNKYRL